jgi:Uncharacterized protein conserved in bacteria
MKSLGKMLKEFRETQQLTLRQVEEATGISNAYLSQLENDKILKPSANVLYKLSEIYNEDIKLLLAAAGIIESQSAPSRRVLEPIAFSTKSDLTQEEEEELIKYLHFIRQSRK